MKNTTLICILLGFLLFSCVDRKDTSPEIKKELNSGQGDDKPPKG